MTRFFLFWRRLLPSSRTGRWAAGVLLVLAVLVAAAWTALPWVVRDLGVAGLERAGASRAEIADVAVEVLAGRLSLEGIVAQGDRPPSSLGRLLVEIDWSDLWSRRGHLTRAEVAGLDLDMTVDADGGLALSGIPLPAAGGSTAAGGGWGIGVDRLRVTDSRLQLTGMGPPLVIEVDRLSLERLHSWSPGAGTTLRLAGRVNGSPLTLEGTLHPFAADRESRLHLTLSGLPAATLLDYLPEGSPVERLAGPLDLDLEATVALGKAGIVVKAGEGTVTAAEGLAWATPGVAADAERGTLTLRSLTAASEEGTATAELTVDLENLEAETDTASARAGRLTWDGQVDATGRAEGRLSVDGLVARDRALDLRLLAERLAVSGRVAPPPPAAVWPLIGQARLEASRVALGGSGETIPALRIEQMTVPEVGVDAGEGLRAATATLSGLRALPFEDGEAWVVEAPSVRLTDLLSRDPARLRASRVDLEGLQGRLRVTDAGIAGLPEAFLRPGTTGTTDAGTPVPLALAVDTVSLFGGRVRFDDPTVDPAVGLEMRDLALTLRNLDTANTEADSPLDLDARIGEFARLSLSGRLRPLAPASKAELTGRLDGMDVVPLAGYLKAFTGAQPASGNVSLDIKARLRDGHLDSDNRVRLQGLEFVEPEGEGPRQVEGVPLESGLDLLRDEQGSIDLALPVTGDVLAPEFDLSDAIGQAVGGVFKGAVTTTLKVIFPPAAIGSWVVSSMEAAALQVPPLTFAPGKLRLDDERMGYLKRVATLMAEHPRVTVNLCGVAVTDDGEALQAAARDAHEAAQADLKPEERTPFTPPTAEEMTAQLKDLARRRAEAAKGLLVGRFEVEQRRIAVCAPRIEERPGAAPRVDISL